jgi:hypothetical protein
MRFDNETLTQDQAQSLRTAITARHSRQIFYGWWVVFAAAARIEHYITQGA